MKHQSLSSSFSILTTSWNYVNSMAMCKKKKNLITPVKINKVTPSERGTVACSILPYHSLHRNIHSVDETAALSPALTHTCLSSSPVPDHPILDQQPTYTWWYHWLGYEGLNWWEISGSCLRCLCPIIVKCHVTAQTPSILCICLLILASLLDFLLLLWKHCQLHRLIRGISTSRPIQQSVENPFPCATCMRCVMPN